MLVAVLRGIVFNKYYIDFVLKASQLNEDHIMSQLPPQSVRRFEAVKRMEYTYIISIPPGEVMCLQFQACLLFHVSVCQHSS